MKVLVELIELCHKLSRIDNQNSLIKNQNSLIKIKIVLKFSTINF